MGKKLLLNTLYSIGIFICILLVYKGFSAKEYWYIPGGLFVGAILLVLKIRILREVRNMQKKP